MKEAHTYTPHYNFHNPEQRGFAIQEAWMHGYGRIVSALGDTGLARASRMLEPVARGVAKSAALAGRGLNLGAYYLFGEDILGDEHYLSTALKLRNANTGCLAGLGLAAGDLIGLTESMKYKPGERAMYALGNVAGDMGEVVAGKVREIIQRPQEPATA